jgi:hypothetical protein
MEKTQRSPDEHIDGLPIRYRDDIRLLDTEIRRRMPGRSRALYEGKMWGGTDQVIIGYGDYQYTGPKGETMKWFIVGLAAQKQYISVYVNAADEEGYLVKRYAPRLGKAKLGSAVVSFKSSADIEMGALMDLVSAAHAVVGSDDGQA